MAPADRERIPRAEIPPSPISGSERSVVAQQQQSVSVNIVRECGRSRNDGIDLAATAGSFDNAAECGAGAAFSCDKGQASIVFLRCGERPSDGLGRHRRGEGAQGRQPHYGSNGSKSKNGRIHGVFGKFESLFS